MAATALELSMCPGIGEAKAKRLYDAFHDPFVPDRARRIATVVGSGANADDHAHAPAAAGGAGSADAPAAANGLGA